MEQASQSRIAVFPKGDLEKLCDGRMSLFEWIEQASTLGADGLEMYPRFFASLDDRELREVKSRADEYGLSIPMMCSSPDFTHPEPAYRAAEAERMKQLIRAMSVLGPESFRSCRVLSGQRRDDVSREDGVRWTVEGIQGLLSYAEEHGVHLVMENHYKDGYWTAPEFAQKSDVFLEIVEQIDSPWFGINYDPSNAIMAGEDPLELLRRLKERVITMHASDRYLKPGYDLSDLADYRAEGYSAALAHGVIGQGLNDYDSIFRELSSVGFRGWISIEDGVNGLDEMRESVRFIRAKIREYL
jgi:sugar phosphate isomerase/epimerase